MPPRSKKGSTINSQVSASTRDGGGSEAPLRAQSISHTTRRSATTTAGGITRAARSASAASTRGARGGVALRGSAVTTPARRCGCAGAASTLMAIRFMSCISEQERAAARGSPLGSGFQALDRQAFQVVCGVVGIEDLAVEEGLLAARGRGRDDSGWQRQLARRLAPEVLTVDLSDQGLGIKRWLEFAPTHVFADEPQVVALEGIGGEVVPVAHFVWAVRDELAR